MAESGMSALPPQAPIAEVQGALRTLAELLAGSDELACAAAREEAVRLLMAANVRSPSRMVDAALPTGSARGASRGGRPTQADLLCECAEEAGAEFWRAIDGTAYATVPVDDHRENVEIRSKSFRAWLRRRYRAAHGRHPSSQPLQDAINAIEAQAEDEDEAHRVFLRLGESDGKVYLDLGDAGWGVVEISEDSWGMIDESPVRFRRTPTMRALPAPVPGGSIDELRDFVNIEDEDDRKMLVGMLVGCLNPDGPYPVLAVHGGQGSAKSTLLRIVRRLIDPSDLELRDLPRGGRNIAVATANARMLAFDNVSRISDFVSDALCRILSGGASSERALYSDRDEVVFQAQMPVLLNGIGDLIERDDLRERAIVLHLPEIRATDRRDERTFWAAFEEARPRILGALLDAAAAALANRDSVHVSQLPRMADFTTWVEAAAPALGWEPSDFTNAYAANQHAAIQQTLTYDAVAQGVQRLMSGAQDTWTGTASDLLLDLQALLPGSHWQWPAHPRATANHLERVRSALETVGISVEHHRTSAARLITIRRAAGAAGGGYVAAA